jgi:tRNA(Met) cytidine acetyltransferase
MPAERDTEQISISSELVNAVHDLIAMAREQRRRRVLVLSGSSHWCRGAAGRLLEYTDYSSVHWFSDRAPSGALSIQGPAALNMLGTEHDALVFDAWSGFDPDAFGALTGTIRAGGLLVLLIPPVAEWPQFPDPQNRRITVVPYTAGQLSGRFLKRLAGVIQSDPDLLLCEQGEIKQRPQGAVEARVALPEEELQAPCRSPDQQRAVEAVVKVVTGHRRRPVVLTSDRGRGKSAAFGIAAAQLISSGRRQILLTGPRLRSVEAVLAHARALLPEQDHGAIRFVAADELVRAPQDADLLLVDEAAAIPAPILESLLKRYARIAFASTVHGYEGTGRGFAVRFNRVLDKHSNSWKSVSLSTPIRWAANDPLEHLTFRMLLLDANAPTDDVLQTAASGDYEIECVDRDQLVEDEAILSELFGLLVMAHYRTRPLDLRHLLDGPNLSVYLLRVNRHVAATALVAAEGGFDADTAQAIWAGRVRPHGHLLPETLAAHQGLMQAPLLHCARIMRIAVHPALQGRGLGTSLVRHITGQVQQADCDYIGTSFGATAELLAFWKRMDWLPVRLSIQRGASSGTRSAVVLKGLTDTGKALAEQARERFFAHFPHQLSDSLYDLDAELVCSLMQNGSAYAHDLNDADRQDLRAFADEQRLLEVSIGSLWRLACRELSGAAASSRLDEKEISLLVARILQKRSWQTCARLIGVPGRAQALAVLRAAVAKLLH